MKLPLQSMPVTRRASSAPLNDRVQPNLCVTGTCQAGGQCCVSIMGQHICIHNPLPIGGSVKACYQFPDSVCFYINSTKIGCVSL